MHRTVQQHLSTLQARLENVSAALMREESIDVRNQLEAELRTIQLAISHYKAALEIEKKLG